MVNTVRKGTRLEKAAEDLLIKNGYNVVTRAIRTKFHKIDLLGVFDIMAYNDDTGELKFVQVKSNRNRPGVVEGIEALKIKSVSKELWIYKDNKGWKKKTID